MLTMSLAHFTMANIYIAAALIAPDNISRVNYGFIFVLAAMHLAIGFLTAP